MNIINVFHLILYTKIYFAHTTLCIVTVVNRRCDVSNTISSQCVCVCVRACVRACVSLGLVIFSLYVKVAKQETRLIVSHEMCILVLDTAGKTMSNNTMYNNSTCRRQIQPT